MPKFRTFLCMYLPNQISFKKAKEKKIKEFQQVFLISSNCYDSFWMYQNLLFL